MSKKDIKSTRLIPIIVLDYCTNTVWRGRIPEDLQSEQVEKWLEEKGIKTSNCYWMSGNFTYEDIN